MQSLCSSDDAMVILDHMETQYYELQLQLYDIQAEILQCEELLLTAQLDSIRRQMTGSLVAFITALLSCCSLLDAIIPVVDLQQKEPKNQKNQIVARACCVERCIPGRLCKSVYSCACVSRASG